LLNRLFRRFKKNERGVAAIELGIILPFLLIPLVMGILEFGWLFNGWIAMRSAAREGARVAVAIKDIDSDTDYITKAVQKHLSNEVSIFPAITPEITSVSTEVTSITINHPQMPKSEGVTVTATGNIRPLVGFFVGSEDFTLSGQATMRIE